jgi:hypothetical protein
VQRQEATSGEEEREEEEELPLQAKEENRQTPEPHPNLESRLRALQGGGQPLPRPVRAFFEPRFGTDFSRVRLHTDEAAGSLAATVQARAFTMGRDIIFGRGHYAPGTLTGKRLLAHELSHVLQQNHNGAIRREANPVAPAREKEGFESTLDAIKTAAKEDALRVQKILQDNIYLGPFNQRNILAIIRPWTQKPAEIPGSRMTSFDYLIVALKLTSFRVGTIVKQPTSAFDQIFYRMSDDRVEQFKTWINTKARIFKNEKPSKLVSLSEEFEPQRLKETTKEFWEEKFKNMGAYLNKIGTPAIIQNLLGGLVGVIQGFAELVIELAEGIWSLAVAVDHLMGALLFFITGALEGGGLGFLQKIPYVGKVFDPKTYRKKYDATVAFFEGVKGALQNPSKIFLGIKDAATKAWHEVLEEYNKADEFNKSRIIARGVVKVGMAVGGFIKNLPSLVKSGVKIAKTVGQLAVKAVKIIEKAIQGVARIAGKIFKGVWKVTEETLKNGAKKLRYYFKKAGKEVFEEVSEKEAKLCLTCASPCKKTEYAKALEESIIEPHRYPEVGPVKVRKPRGFEPTIRPALTRAAEARAEFKGKVRDSFAKKLGVGKGGQVHHAIELDVLDRYPWVYTSRELNSLKNMRGIPAELMRKMQLHQSKIREIWNRNYSLLDQKIAKLGLNPGTAKYNNLVREVLSDAVKEIDFSLDQFFSEYRMTLKWIKAK